MAESEVSCDSPEPDDSTKVNPSVEYLKDFQQMKLSDGTMAEAIGMELDQLRIVRYKQFMSDYSLSLDEAIEKAYVLDVAGSLTTLVGPNNSGKTTLLKAVKLFCNAVRYGSGHYTFGEANRIFGIEQSVSHVLLQGTFTVHYQNTTITKQLKLDVILPKLGCTCLRNDKYWNIELENVEQEKNSSEQIIRIYITKSHVNLPYYLYYRTACCSSTCEAYYRLFSLRRTDYTTLTYLFPKVEAFNSKSEITRNLKELFSIKQVQNNKKNIVAEIARIFPSIQINYKDEIDIERLPTSEQMNRKICIPTQEYLPVMHTGVKELVEDEIVDQYVEDISICSEGVLHCLNLIKIICCAEPNLIITIDEPDSHVFPNAQKLLINLFHRKLNEFRLSKQFCQMIITTHSTDIMQAVELKTIRQIFLRPSSHIPMEIKSLSNTDHLLGAMSTLGTSILGHDEIVRLGVHRKLLYLENREDFDFMSGIIKRVKPELLLHPFTIVYKGGRPQPDQIRQLIPGFRHFIPKNSTLSIFVLVDSDLRRQKKLQDEIKEYDLLETEKVLKVKTYYHCWAAHEWENWLLSNENLLFDMLFSNELEQEKSIQALRQQINNIHPRMLGTFQPNESVTTTAVTTTDTLQTYTGKEKFLKWFKDELSRHYDFLITDDLTLNRMEGSEKNDRWDSKELEAEGRQFLYNSGVDDEQMKQIFGRILIPTLQSIGAQDRKCNIPQRQSQTEKEKEDYLKTCQNNWLDDRQIKPSIDLDDEQVRKAVTKWIDAKKFFYELTHGRIIKKKGVNVKTDLDEYWKGAFRQDSSHSDGLYSRYFNKLDPQNQQTWPDDFSELLKKFEEFVTTQ